MRIAAAARAAALLAARLVRGFVEDMGQLAMLVLYALLVIGAAGTLGLAWRAFRLAAGFE